MHCLNSYTSLEATISKNFPREVKNTNICLINSWVVLEMALIHRKLPHFVLEKTWDKKTLKLPVAEQQFL